MNQTLKMMNQMQRLYHHLCIDIMDQYHLTRNELDILLFLYNNPDLDTAKDIVEKRGLIKSHVSMSVHHLIKKHYLEAVKDKKDKRCYHLYLLDDSKEIIEKGLVVQKEFQKILFKDFSIEEMNQLKNMLTKMYCNIEGVL